MGVERATMLDAIVETRNWFKTWMKQTGTKVIDYRYLDTFSTNTRSTFRVMFACNRCADKELEMLVYIAHEVGWGKAVIDTSGMEVFRSRLKTHCEKAHGGRKWGPLEAGGYVFPMPQIPLVLRGEPNPNKSLRARHRYRKARA